MISRDQRCHWRGSPFRSLVQEDLKGNFRAAFGGVPVHRVRVQRLFPGAYAESEFGSARFELDLWEEAATVSGCEREGPGD